MGESIECYSIVKMLNLLCAGGLIVIAIYKFITAVLLVYEYIYVAYWMYITISK